MYTKEAFINDSLLVFRETDGNTVEISGIGKVELYDAPLIAFAAADDSLFEQFKEPEIIGANFLTPVNWLPQAKTVVSFFLPFTKEVCSSNRADQVDPSPQWLYARIEGQEFINRFITGIQQLLRGKQIETCIPGLDQRFSVQFEKTCANGVDDLHADSRWSERHIAYACGLGTFGLSRGLITQKGMAGRFTSIIVSEKWQETGRDYTGIDDYCIKCGICAEKCPVRAISPEQGKNNILCRACVESTKERFPPRYGCGKCQVGVPCEFEAPGRKAGKTRVQTI